MGSSSHGDWLAQLVKGKVNPLQCPALGQLGCEAHPWLSQTIPGRTSAVVLTPYLTLLRSPSALQLSDW